MIEGLSAELLAGKFATMDRLVDEVRNPPEVVPTDERVRTVPGPRVPPGMAAILHEDATTRALDEAGRLHGDVWGVIRDAADERGLDVLPDVRTIAGAQLVIDDDELSAYGLWDDVVACIAALGSVVRRYERVIQTGHRCLDFACRGHYVVPAREGRASEALVCDRCGDTVGYDVWSRWPRARVVWLTPEHAAKRLGRTVGTVRVRAHRERWRKVGTGRQVRYHVDDVDKSGRRDQVEGSAA